MHDSSTAPVQAFICELLQRAAPRCVCHAGYQHVHVVMHASDLEDEAWLRAHGVRVNSEILVMVVSTDGALVHLRGDGPPHPVTRTVDLAAPGSVEELEFALPAQLAENLKRLRRRKA